MNGPVNGKGVEKTGRARFVAGELKEWEYRWILELAQYKKDRFPSLVFVSLREATRQVMSCYKSEEWIPPACVENAYQDAAICLEVFVRRNH